jgi:putative membrane protein
MPPSHHAALESFSSSIALALVLVLLSFSYARGWRRVRAAAVSAIPVWRLVSFLLGMSLIWVALGSLLVAYDHDSLTVHMIQHLLLMTFAPALILLGDPMHAFWHGLQQFGQNGLARLLRWPPVQTAGRTLSHPTFCWLAGTAALVGWHIPALFTLGLQSGVWHTVEQASFLGAGFLFWWPVVQPCSGFSAKPQWSILLYLFLATLPCDILSAFLVFSERVAYPVLSSSLKSGLSVLEDQQCAGASMWTCVTLVYLVPAAILTMRLLSPQTPRGGEELPAESRRSAVSQRSPQSVEFV